MAKTATLTLANLAKLGHPKNFVMAPALSQPDTLIRQKV
jgi:hypothetical protein